MTVTNQSSQPLMWLQFKAFRGSNGAAITGRPRGERNAPLVMPNSEYTFEITTSTGGLDAADEIRDVAAKSNWPLEPLMWRTARSRRSAVRGNSAPWTPLRVAQITALLRGRVLAGWVRQSPTVRGQIAKGMTSNLETRTDGTLWSPSLKQEMVPRAAIAGQPGIWRRG